VNSSSTIDYIRDQISKFEDTHEKRDKNWGKGWNFTNAEVELKCKSYLGGEGWRRWMLNGVYITEIGWDLIKVRQDSSGTQQAGKKHVPTLSKENVKENKESILGYLGKVFNFDRFFSMIEVVFHKSF